MWDYLSGTKQSRPLKKGARCKLFHVMNRAKILKSKLPVSRKGQELRDPSYRSFSQQIKDLANKASK